MKLLLVGSDEVWSLEKHYTKYLGEVGVNVKVCPLQSIFYKYYNKGIVYKILFKLGFSGIEKTMSGSLKTTVEEFQPDVVWVFKGMEVAPEVLKWIKAKGIKTVNYNPDNPFLFSGKGSGNKNLTNSIGLYDLHFSYDREIKSRIEKDYGIPCKILPFGFELNDQLYQECCKEKELLKLCFLGNPDKERAEFIMELADEVTIDVYGNDWGKFVQHKNISVFPPVYDNDFWKTLRKYRAQLNLMRPHNPNSHNMRSFEVPGVGAIGLFPRTPDHEQYFNEGQEIFLYQNMMECKKLAIHILNMSETVAFEVRERARNRSLDSGYSYYNRALQSLSEIKKLLA
jgi:spore maturation protein CgeB